MKTRNYLQYYAMADSLQSAIYVLTKTKFQPLEDAERQVIAYAIKYIDSAIEDLLAQAQHIEQNTTTQELNLSKVRPSSERVFKLDSDS